MKGSKPIFVFKILVTACVLALIACLAVDALSEGLCVKIVQARGGLHVRSDPNADASIIYLLEDATTVIVLEYSNGWYRVAYNTPPHVELGWACGDYLR